MVWFKKLWNRLFGSLEWDYLALNFEGTKITCPVVCPKKIIGGVVYCHGWFGGTGDAWDYEDVFGIAKAGFMVLVLDYVGSQNGPQDDDLMRDVRQVKAVVNFLRQRQGLKQVYVMGVSRGGYVALHSMISFQEEISGAVVCVAPTDLSRWRETTLITPEKMKEILPYFAGGGLQQRSPARERGDLLLASPVHKFMKLADRPLLLCYGSEDRIVPPEQGAELYGLLTGSGKATLKIFPYGHGLSVKPDVIKCIVSWLLKLSH